MISEQEALTRIERSVRHYETRCITRGEAMEDVVDTLHASGRLIDHEARSWAPRKRARRRATASSQSEARV